MLVKQAGKKQVWAAGECWPPAPLHTMHLIRLMQEKRLELVHADVLSLDLPKLLLEMQSRCACSPCTHALSHAVKHCFKIAQQHLF